VKIGQQFQREHVIKTLSPLFDEYQGFLVQGFWFRVSGSGLLVHLTQKTPDDTYRNTPERSNSERLMVWVWRSGYASGLLRKLKLHEVAAFRGQ